MIVGDEKIQPITYNHYFTDNVQKARHGRLKGSLKRAFELTSEEREGKLISANDEVNHKSLLRSLQMNIQVDMNQQACEEASTALSAYYKVRIIPWFVELMKLNLR